MHNLLGTHVVMTGGTSGLGLEVTKYLLDNKAKVFLFFRNESKIAELKKYDNCIPVMCDLSSMNSIELAIAEVKRQTQRIDILINNAGMWVFGERRLSKDNIELTFHVNLLAPYMLMNAFAENLRQGKTPIVINTASALHQGFINWDDPEYKQASFSGFKAYRQSKLGILLLTKLLSQRWKDEIKVVSNHPGLVSTNLAKEAGWFMRWLFSIIGKSPKKGAETIIHFIENREMAVSGAYYANKKIATTSTKETQNMESAIRLEKLMLKYIKHVQV
jgi:retinol dehydrogenase 12